MIHRIQIGSNAFFSYYADFVPHDLDFVEFQSEPKLFKTFMMAKSKGKDVFYYKIMPKNQFIKYELNRCKTVPMAVGKLLVPELAKFIGLTIEDLKQFEFAFENIDDKHKYEKIIYHSYIENEAFTLTQEQRDKAYKVYLDSRKQL